MSKQQKARTGIYSRWRVIFVAFAPPDPLGIGMAARLTVRASISDDAARGQRRAV